MVRRKHKTPTRSISAKSMLDMLHNRIIMYERRYETSSKQMLNKLSAGEVLDTAEILQWMQDYHALQLLETTLTSGTPTSNTE